MAVKFKRNPPAPWQRDMENEICQGSIYQYSLIIEVATFMQLSDTNRLNQSHVNHESGTRRRPQ